MLPAFGHTHIACWRVGWFANVPSVGDAEAAVHADETLSSQLLVEGPGSSGLSKVNN